MGKKINLFTRICSLLLLCGCGAATIQDGPPDAVGNKAMPEPIPKWLPKSKTGNAASYQVLGKTYHVLATASGYHQTGIASWYGSKFSGQKTSTGDIYNPWAMTAAHRTLPIPCYVRVKNLGNGKQVIVLVNDRGPFVKDRIIDLSYAAAKKIDMLDKGTAMVSIQTITTSIKPVSAKPNPTAGHIWQLGAFRDRQHAEIQLKNLQQQFPLLIPHAQVVARPPFYLILWFAPYSISEITIAEYRQRLQQQFGIDAFHPLS